MNIAILIGRLTRDPELRYTPAGKAVATFTIAVDRMKEGTDFIDCVAWGQTAENVNKYCGKGKEVAVEGRIAIRKYLNRDNQNVKVTEVIAEKVKFLRGNGITENQETDEPIVDHSPFDTF